MEALDTITENGFTASIYQDFDAPDPRKDFDHVGTMVCWHRREMLGDEQFSDFAPRTPKDLETLERYVRITRHAAVFIWLGLYDHSGLHMYAGGGSHAFDSAGWDSGTVGFIYCTREQVQKEWNGDLDAARKCLLAEIEEYDQYLTGEVYYFEITSPSGDVLDGCGGCFGADYARSEAKSQLHYFATEQGSLFDRDAYMTAEA